MRVLVIGGGGYIGARLVPLLLFDGHQVTVVDPGEASYLPKENENLTILKGDIVNGIDCDGQDSVICLASITRESDCQGNPERAYEINVEGAWKAAQAAKGKRFIFASSVGVYGCSDSPLTEDSFRSPTTLYGRGKHKAETLILEHHPEAVLVRAASVCGFSPRQRFDLTINRMFQEATQKNVITVAGGYQVRSHVHIDDLCDFYRLLLKTEVSGAFNVVHSNQTLAESAFMVANIITDTGIHVMSWKEKSYPVSGEKAKTVLGWTPTRSLEKAVLDLKDAYIG